MVWTCCNIPTLVNLPMGYFENDASSCSCKVSRLADGGWSGVIQQSTKKPGGRFSWRVRSKEVESRVVVLALLVLQSSGGHSTIN